MSGKAILMTIFFITGMYSCKSLEKSSLSKEVGEMTRFSNCDHKTDSQIELTKCAQLKLTTYLNNELASYKDQFPIAKFTDDFIMTFKILPSGRVTEVESHDGTDKDLQDIMTKIFIMMPDWIPAKNVDGKSIAVRLAIPLIIVRGKVSV